MVESGNLSAPDARPCVAASARRPRPAAHCTAGVVLALLSGLLTRIRISIATGAAVGICGDRWRTGFRARSPNRHRTRGSSPPAAKWHRRTEVAHPSGRRALLTVRKLARGFGAEADRLPVAAGGNGENTDCGARCRPDNDDRDVGEWTHRCRERCGTDDDGQASTHDRTSRSGAGMPFTRGAAGAGGRARTSAHESSRPPGRKS